MHKPSILWPPPGDDESKQVRQTIRHRLRKVAGLGDQDRFTSLLRPMGHKHEPLTADQVADAGRQMELDPPASVPSPVDGQFQRVALETKDGESLIVDSQIQFYAPNTLLAHPLICHCRAYLGGLPPLFFIAGDQEVLRDEIIYTCVLYLHYPVSLLICIQELIEQQTPPSTRFRLNPNDCIPRSQSSPRNTPHRPRFTSKFTMGVHMCYLSSSRSPLQQNTVSERSPVFVIS